MNKNEHYAEIQAAIRNGIKKTCSLLFVFQGQNKIQVKPEYLTTVCVAQEIGSKNNYFASPYLIKIEEKTKDFADKCIPNSVLDKTDIFAEMIFRNSKPNSKRNGRVDLAIYIEGYDSPITAIELGLINPAKKKVQGDVTRIQDFLIMKDPQTGISRIDEVYFASILVGNNVKTPSQINPFLSRQRRKYEKWLNQTIDSEFVSPRLTPSCRPI